MVQQTEAVLDEGLSATSATLQAIYRLLADTVDPPPQAKAAGGCAALHASQELACRDCDHAPGINLGRSWVECVHAQRMKVLFEVYRQMACPGSCEQLCIGDLQRDASPAGCCQAFESPVWSVLVSR